MATSWCKVASNLDSHPKIRRAGRNGREVFLFALRRNAEPNNPVPGRLPADELEPWYVADQLQMSETEARDGVTAAVTAGLLAIDGNSYVITSWKDGWGKGVSGGAERTRKWRENKALQNAVTSRDSGDVTRDSGDACDTDKKRREEKRSEREGVSGKPDPAAAFAEKAVELINAASGSRYQPTSEAVIRLCRALVKNKHTVADLEAVVASKRAWVGDPKMGQFFRPATLLAAKNFATYLDDLRAHQGREANGTSTGATYCTVDRDDAVSPLMLAFVEQAGGEA